MFRIDSPGATVNNLFTEGNPSLGVPATEVSADWLNAVQEEMAVFIENQGITLDKLNSNQLEAAINAVLGFGGTQISQSINNNEAVAQDVTGLLFSSVDVKAAKMDFDLERKTDTQILIETGTIHVTFDQDAANWRLSLSSVFDDAGVTFSITASGQIQYISTDVTGTNYASNLRVTNTIKFKQ